jgi:serine/threonine-protein kinase HipA
MTKSTTRRNILVYAHWLGMSEPIFIGTLHSERIRGKEIFSFVYDGDWLKSEHAQQLDPDLQLYPGIQYLSDTRKINFGLFLDSSPDQWGRLLMQRKEAALAGKELRESRSLYETDYLLGLYDKHRMGALRFKLESSGPFLDDSTEMTSPSTISLRELEQISLKLEDDASIEDPHYLEWLKMLLAPGSSLGGARPKANVLDNSGNLWIAKFPSRRDNFDVGGWEIVIYELSKAAGINMAESYARKFSSDQHTFITKRFDRTHNQERIHFASAMTMLGCKDGDSYQEGVSYLEIAEFLIANGANVNDDLKELWRRIVFNICVSNVDDHLRNHGFILTPLGWILSPAYDINPTEHAIGLKLNISENDNSLSLDLAMEVYEYFRLSESEARTIINQVKSAVSNWRKVAQTYGIRSTEQELKSSAFRTAK